MNKQLEDMEMQTTIEEEVKKVSHMEELEKLDYIYEFTCQFLECEEKQNKKAVELLMAFFGQANLDVSQFNEKEKITMAHLLYCIGSENDLEKISSDFNGMEERERSENLKKVTAAMEKLKKASSISDVIESISEKIGIQALEKFMDKGFSLESFDLEEIEEMNKQLARWEMETTVEEISQEINQKGRNGKISKQTYIILFKKLLEKE